MKTPGCTIIGTVVAKPDKRDELMRILAAQVTPTRAEPGCINYDFHCDKADPNVFVFYENFESRVALDEHLKKAHLKPLMDRLDELLAEPVHIRHLEMLSLRAEQ
jgi:quinol monooxygenase YgiN